MRAFAERVAELSGLRADSGVQVVAEATLETLAAGLPSADRGRLWAVLPDALVERLRGADHVPMVRAEDLYDAVAAHERVGDGFAIEHAQAVMEALSERLPAEDRAILCRHLPDDVAELLRPRAEHGAGPHAHAHPHRAAGESHTLSHGRAGSRQPLSEGEPKAGQLGSVARWDGSRSERTLADYQGEQADADHETLATGKPGSGRPLSEGGED